MAAANILNVAHRGGADHAPENTFAAFDNAPSLGTTWVESDLRCSSDGEIVLLHDSSVDRTTDGTGDVAQLSVAELKALDAGSWFDARYSGERIPTLAEFFARYRGRLQSMLEIKAPEHVEERLVELIAAGDHYDETVIIGSNRNALVQVKSLDARIEVGWTAFEPSAQNVELALDMGCHHIGIKPSNLTIDIVAQINSRGLAVRATCVHGMAEIEHVVSCGVMGMTIDSPVQLVAHLASLEG
jgi:glycerophosphoryl diester phosphodiesterase